MTADAALTRAAALGAVSAKWLAAGLSTAPADRDAAADAVRLAYRSAGLPEPAHIVWFASPSAGARAAALLTGRRDLPGGPEDKARWDEEIAAELRAQGCPPSPGTAGVSVRAAVRNQPWAAARAEVYALLGPDGWAGLWSACGADVWRMVNDRVAAPLRAHLRTELPSHARTVLLDAVGGQHDAGWLAAFDAAASGAADPSDPAAGTIVPWPRSAADDRPTARGDAGSTGSTGNGAAATHGIGGAAGVSPGWHVPGSAAGVDSATRGAGGNSATRPGDGGGAATHEISGNSAGAAGDDARGTGGDGAAGGLPAAGRAGGAVLHAVQRLAGLAGVARSAGWWWPYANVAILTDRPDSLQRDNIGRLHAADMPALRYSDGFALHAWRGMPIPSDLVDRLSQLTSDQITTERNAELRRVMLEHFGYERYLREAGAQQAGQDACGVLWRLTFADDEPLTMVEVVNSTPEPDGTSRIYWLRVPPWTRTAREGVAWTFGLTKEEYRPLVET
ncbi:hypothetical protein Dfulv_37330 [Dactylosporangium fulvum]|uniref:DUF6745 domain-containing protein n=1 Tax=Dactylosporangium fulvum TaxID=53359 RepID=A0ABY5VUJ5_9ACTN|nr:hypothetical protein [Dactylosporangium fulvum]UWP80766.1 hypothetical protein Dfulv_37330 [Dactylosporangium fulvum]